MYGGSFDPVHCGHVAVARAAVEAFGLGWVEMAPTGRQPLKEEAEAAYYQRLAMVELACQGDERLRVCGLDGPQYASEDGANYTVDLLRRIEAARGSGGGGEVVQATENRAVSGEKARVFVIVGADSFLSLRKWRDPERLLRMAEWIVVSRPGFGLGDLSGLALTAKELGRVHLLETVHEEVSATEIRRRLKAGESCEGLLPAGVEAYIREKGLYR